MENKVAFITGGCSGIGKAIACEFARKGYDIAVSYNSSKGGVEELKETGARVVAIKTDISEYSQIINMFDEFNRNFNRLDVFVNNAGITEIAPFLDTSEEMFDTINDVDFKGAYFCMQNAAKIMVDKNINGNIILISSNNAYAHYANVSAYGAVKAAVTKLAEHMAIELAQYGIRVNTIAPGWTDTKAKRMGNPEDTYYKIPLKKWATPQEIADNALFLCSPSAASITGATIVVDNGALLVSDKREKYGF